MKQKKSLRPFNLLASRFEDGLPTINDLVRVTYHNGGRYEDSSHYEWVLSTPTKRALARWIAGLLVGMARVSFTRKFKVQVFGKTTCVDFAHGEPSLVGQIVVEFLVPETISEEEVAIISFFPVIIDEHAQPLVDGKKR
jgi:hypothetical protein